MRRHAETQELLSSSVACDHGHLSRWAKLWDEGVAVRRGVCQAARAIEASSLRLDISCPGQISSTITAAKPVHRKDTARSISTMFELISLSLTSQIQIVELSREISSLGVVYR